MPTIALVGAGNVATHLAHAFARKGVEIRGVYSRTMASATALAESLHAASYAAAHLATPTDSLDLLADADVYILAVKDDALPHIAAAWPESKRGRVVLHTAGSVAMDVLAPAAEHYGVLYPMQTFTKTGTVDFSKITAFVEGSDAVALHALAELAQLIFGNCQPLSSADRQYLHLAAVFACNFVNHMYATAYDLLSHHGIDPSCLLPLIAETAQKVERTTPREAQTGPARRGDRNIVAKHAALLTDETDAATIYQTISDSIMRKYNA